MQGREEVLLRVDRLEDLVSAAERECAALCCAVLCKLCPCCYKGVCYVAVQRAPHCHGAEAQ